VFLADLLAAEVDDRIPEPSDQTAHCQRRGSRGGRPRQFGAADYKSRNVIERPLNNSSNDAA
jgi:hypothetical protein